MDFKIVNAPSCGRNGSRGRAGGSGCVQNALVEMARAKTGAQIGNARSFNPPGPKSGPAFPGHSQRTGDGRRLKHRCASPGPRAGEQADGAKSGLRASARTLRSCSVETFAFSINGLDSKYAYPHPGLSPGERELHIAPCKIFLLWLQLQRNVLTAGHQSTKRWKYFSLSPGERPG